MTSGFNRDQFRLIDSLAYTHDTINQPSILIYCHGSCWFHLRVVPFNKCVNCFLRVWLLRVATNPQRTPSKMDSCKIRFDTGTIEDLDTQPAKRFGS
jgi:hypothetical protein